MKFACDISSRYICLINAKQYKVMKRILILGGGTAGTTMSNKLRKALPANQWNITVVDKYKTHYYQPGFLFIPFGTYTRKDVEKPKQKFFPKGVDVIYSDVEIIEGDKSKVILKDGRELFYDYLIIATGTQTRPDQTPGLTDNLWYQKIFDFYTMEGALALHRAFEKWQGGTLLISIAELPFKCPVAPLEFAFLADAYFTKRGMRHKVTIKYTTPLSGAFTKPLATKMLSDLLAQKNIEVIPDFYIESIDNENQQVLAYDGRAEAFDILTIVPVNMGDQMIERSGLGDDFNHVPVDKYSMQSLKFPNVYAVGDASNLPTSKAGSVAHFACDILFENLMHIIENKPATAKFDGHANCYIETGFGKAALIDFNYDVEPLPGTFPLPVVGPFSLLKSTRINHFGKLFFRWIYWNLLITGKNIPVSSLMSMTGKKK